MSDCTTSYEPTDTMPAIYDDGLSIAVDFDGDGWSETIVTDTNADGIGDAYDFVDPYTGMQIIALDADLDGLLDTMVVDNDGDGEFDEAMIDSDGDGEFETELDPGVTTVPFDDPALDPALDAESADNDESDDSDDGVHGQPMAEIPYHQAQVGPNDCLPTSVAMVLSEATGTTIPQADLVDLAEGLGVLGPDGMSLEGGVQLLDHYGVDAEVQTGSLDDLRTLLDQGTPVIIGLDADDLYGMGDQPFSDDIVSGHAVVITGIDDEAGLVYLNDPGFPDGAGVAVPLDDFEDAWVDGGNSMIVADLDDTRTDTTTGTTTDTTTDMGVPAGSTIADGAASGASAASRSDELALIDLVLLPLRLVIR